MKKIYLHDGWTLYNEKTGKLSATVPGCVHTDLLAHKVIDDPFYRDNSLGCQWIENEDWSYSTTFDAELGEASLVFEGLDTYTDIYLNGERLGGTDNMFIPHAFDVTGKLKSENNVLEVRFRSPIKEVEGCPQRSGAFTTERINTRRIQCTYSWDWCERLVTCGIYRPVYLSYKNGIDVKDVFVCTDSIDRFSAQLYVEIEFENTGKGEVATLEIIAPDGKTVAQTAFFADLPKFIRRIDVPSPELWYPAGYGDQPLYTIRVSVGENLLERTFGIRTVKIVQLTDPEGSEYREKALAIAVTDQGKRYSHNSKTSGFAVIVNGEQVFCRGGNWVPCEPFPSAETDEKIRFLVKKAREMGANFLRVWGGGLFEKEAFYDECDRQGILVAQDFLMACGIYPEYEDWFINALKRESEFAVRYLRNHPCLAWWHGDNENATLGNDLLPDYFGRRSALLGLADAIYTLDRRPFLLSSPFGGDVYASLTAGTAHITNYLGGIFVYFTNESCTDYKEYFSVLIGRFVSEDGTFGASGRSSMLRFMTEDDLLNDESEEMILFHTKNNPGLHRHLFYNCRDFAEKILGKFENGEDKFFKYKYIQYEWVRVVFENHRRNMGYSNGLVFWMFNDCWPAALGWSFVDYYRMPKASYYSFNRLSAPVVTSVDVKDGKYFLYISADKESVSVKSSTTAYLLKNGKVVNTCTLTAEHNGYGATATEIPFGYDADAVIVCDTEWDGGSDRCFYKNGGLEIVPTDAITVERNENTITITAKEYVHAVEIECDLTLSDNYFSLMNGESKTISLPESEKVNVVAYTLKNN